MQNTSLVSKVTSPLDNSGMQYIICKWKIYLALPEKRERDPREHPFKRNMVASDPDGMVSDPDGMIKRSNPETRRSIAT
mgnify:CR=1 FL=1